MLGERDNHYTMETAVEARPDGCFQIQLLKCNKIKSCNFRYSFIALVDLREGDARDAWPPSGSKFFHFHAVFGKKLVK